MSDYYGDGDFAGDYGGEDIDLTEQDYEYKGDNPIDKDSSIDEDEEKKDDLEDEEGEERESGESFNPVSKSSLSKNRIVYITGDDRRSKPLMTIYEYARLVGAYADILAGDVPVHPDIAKIADERNIDKVLELSKLTLDTITVPFPIKIERPIGPNKFEVWDVRELILPHDYINIKRPT